MLTKLDAPLGSTVPASRPITMRDLLTFTCGLGFLRERVFAPLGMADTGFSVPAGALDRLPPQYATAMLAGGGSYRGVRILSRPTVSLMTRTS